MLNWEFAAIANIHSVDALGYSYGLYSSDEGLTKNETATLQNLETHCSHQFL